ncbi:hypothetical protein [uncultured Campylobacter sp.]|uniref:hypothetical protein n=1 Tax=uncultured Campylobacter sp. TaxID=218934 RepID=UPI00261B2439|nr:hypothetical protein [uncultured Campylobacter sp.]
MTNEQAKKILADIANDKDVRTSSGAKVTAENFEKFFLNDMVRKLGTKSEGDIYERISEHKYVVDIIKY